MGSTAQELLTCVLRQGLSLGLRADQLGCTGQPGKPKFPLACASPALDYSVPPCPAFLFVPTVLTGTLGKCRSFSPLETRRLAGSEIPRAVIRLNTPVEALTARTRP